MAKKSFDQTAFFKNAKRIIQREKNGAFALTGYTGSGKTELLKELIMIFEDVYAKSTNSLEMKEEELSLESAFIKLVEDRPEYSQKEIKKMQYEKEIEELREEENNIKEEKEFRKQAKTKE